jgi:large subunit ribosomal protein L30
MKKIRIKQIQSGIDRPERQKRTLRALGIKKMGQVVELEATPQIVGMVKKIGHLLSVEEVK